jgi:hypothetical protein
VIVVCMTALFGAPLARAQTTTGSITGSVTDASGAVLPGVAVTLTGENLIGGAQVQTTDGGGNYRFDRLPPGTYRVKFEMQGFKTIERPDIRINAAFVATVPVKMEVGAVTESVTVSGESPTVDTKSNVRQTVMDQQILEGIPTGRDLSGRIEHQRCQLQHRRRHGELAGRRRRRDDAVLRPGHVRGNQLHHRRYSGRVHGRWHLDQHGDEGRRQPVARQHALLLLE